MFHEPEKREVMREQGLHYARENNLIYIDECSALADININETFMVLV